MPFQIPFSVLSFCSHSIRTSFYLVNSVFSKCLSSTKPENVKEWEGIPPHFFFEWRNNTPLISLPLLSNNSSFRKSRFLSQQPNEQWILSFFKWQRVFLAIPLLSSGPTFPTPFSSFFSLPWPLSSLFEEYHSSFSIHSLLFPSFVCFNFKSPPQNQWGLFMCFSVDEFLIEFILIVLVFVECVSWIIFCVKLLWYFRTIDHIRQSFFCSYLLNRFKLTNTCSLFCCRVYQMKMWIRFFSLYFVKGFSLFQRVKASIPFWFELFILPFLSIVSILSSNQNTTTH